jgi:hypothetical protein
MSDELATAMCAETLKKLSTFRRGKSLKAEAVHEIPAAKT